MSQKAEVRVGLDTSAAKADLRKLAKEGEQSAGRVNDALGGGLGRSASIGAVAGMGFGLAQRAASRVAGFMPDIISESTVGARAFASEMFGGPEARAATSAREQTKAAYREIIGRQENPTFTPEMKNYYNNIRNIREIGERGDARIDQMLGGEFVKDAVTILSESITSGFDRIVAALPIGGK
jgi:hypothetical protein